VGLHDAAATPSIEATLNFLRPMRGRPVAYQYEPRPDVLERTGQYDQHRVSVQDGRPLTGRLSLDVQGFALLNASSAFGDFGDEVAIRSAYYAEVEKALRPSTGAAPAINFDHNIRSAATGKADIKGPVDRTQKDFTARPGRDRAKRELETLGSMQTHSATAALRPPISGATIRQVHPMHLSAKASRHGRSSPFRTEESGL
jgi:hypothetical protein